MQNTTQIKVAQRRQLLPPLRQIPALKPMAVCQKEENTENDQTQAQTQTQTQVEVQSRDQPEQQNQKQDEPPQLQVESQPKPKLKPLKARCRKLWEGASQIWQVNMDDVYEKRAFFMSPCPPGLKMQCTFKRYRGCFSHRYECYLVRLFGCKRYN